MTLEQLRIFIAVAEREHLTRAAEALNLTPSAVSAAIHALESRYSVRLFDRVGRGIELTRDGRTFLAEAKATQRSARSSELTLAELGGLRRGTLTIQASQTIASYWLPPFLVTFKTAYPAVDVVLHGGNSTDVARAVHDGSADLGFMEGDVVDPTLGFATVARDRMVVVGAPDHPLATTKKAATGDLSEASWILREQGSGTRSMFEAALRARAIDPGALRIVLELPTNEAVCAAVLAGPHLTVVSEMVARAHVEAGRLASVPFDLGTRSFHLVRHKQRYRTRASEAFEDMLPRIGDGSAGAPAAVDPGF